MNKVGLGKFGSETAEITKENVQVKCSGYTAFNRIGELIAMYMFKANVLIVLGNSENKTFL